MSGLSVRARLPPRAPQRTTKSVGGGTNGVRADDECALVPGPLASTARAI